MNKHTSTLILSLLLILFSCNNNRKPLQGEYEILGISRAENITWEEFKNAGYDEFGEEQFIFSGKNQLRVNETLSQLIFNNNVELTYEFLNDDLVLFGLDTKEVFKFKCVSNGLGIDLTWNHPYFVGFQLSPKKKVNTAGTQF